jgi:hypothetical protein
LVVAVSIVETIVSSTWLSAYFRFGLVLFRAETSVTERFGPVPDGQVLEARLRGDVFRAILFRPVGTNQYGFRETTKLGSFGFYTPVMHGLLAFHPGTGRVVVVGFANWGALGFLALLLCVTGLIALVAVGAGGLVLGSVYVIQRRRFKAVLDAAVASWSVSRSSGA